MINAEAPAVPVRSELPPVNRYYLIAVLGMLTMLPPLSTTMALPAGRAMATDLHVGPTILAASLSAFFFGFGIGQLFWGPVADRFGRRGPMLIGLALYTGGSLGAALTSSGDMLILWRFVQAIGGCAPPVLVQAMVRDRFDHRDAAGVLSVMMLITNLAPLLAPNLGGLLLLRFDWRGIFWALASFGIVSSIGVLTLPESNPPERRRIVSWQQMALGYLVFFKDRRYLAYLLSVACFGVAFFGWLAGSQFVYMSYYRVSPQLFALILGAGITTTMAFNVLNKSLVKKVDPDRLLRFGLIMATISGLAATLVALHPADQIWPLTIALSCFVGSQGLVTSNTTAGALADYPHSAGTAAALLGATRAGMGAIGGLLVGAFADGTPLPTAVVVGAMSLLALLLNLALLRPRLS